MQSDGSYIKRIPTDETAVGSQEKLIQEAEERQKEALRLKKRKTRVISHRNVRQDAV
jgi:polyphosphate kinase